MKWRIPPICLAAAVSLFAPTGLGFSQQTRVANPSDATFDPLKQVTSSFPQSITLNTRKRTLEFCPDETCHRFVGSADVSITSLKDFAYLYIYFYSDFYILRDWRRRAEPQSEAQRVLSKPEYRNCKLDNQFDSARCVLLGLSRKGSVRLEFIRGDEGARNVVREDVVRELTEKPSPPAQ